MTAPVNRPYKKPGRKPGSQDGMKVTQSIKENVVLAFELLGGVEEYTAWAKKNPSKFYDHWIKLLPAEIKAEVSVSTDFAPILEKARERTLKLNEERQLGDIATEVRRNVFNTAIDQTAVEGEFVEILEKRDGYR